MGEVDQRLHLEWVRNRDHGRVCPVVWVYGQARARELWADAGEEFDYPDVPQIGHGFSTYNNGAGEYRIFRRGYYGI